MLYVNAPSELRECGAGSPQVLGHELEAHGLGAERLWERHGSTALLGEKRRKGRNKKERGLPPPPPAALTDWRWAAHSRSRSRCLGREMTA